MDEDESIQEALKELDKKRGFILNDQEFTMKSGDKEDSEVKITKKCLKIVKKGKTIEFGKDSITIFENLKDGRKGKTII